MNERIKLALMIYKRNPWMWVVDTLIVVGIVVLILR